MTVAQKRRIIWRGKIFQWFVSAMWRQIRTRTRGRGTPRGLIRKRLDWFDSKANNATSPCRQTPFGTAKAAARLNLNSLSPFPPPHPPPRPTSKLICEGRVDRANRNSAVQISYPRFPRARRLAKQASDRLLRARGMSLQRDENIFENSHLSRMSLRARDLGEKSRAISAPRVVTRAVRFSPRHEPISTSCRNKSVLSLRWKI